MMAIKHPLPGFGGGFAFTSETSPFKHPLPGDLGAVIISTKQRLCGIL